MSTVAAPANSTVTSPYAALLDTKTAAEKSADSGAGSADRSPPRPSTYTPLCSTRKSPF